MGVDDRSKLTQEKKSQTAGNDKVNLGVDPEPELVQSKGHLSRDKVYVGSEGKEVEIITNRVNILEIPKQISAFHFSFATDEKGVTQKQDLMRFLSKDKKSRLPLAYDGSQIVVQYRGIGEKGVHSDEYVLSCLSKLLKENKLRLDSRVNLSLDLKTRELSREELQYLDIIFSNTVPTEAATSLGDRRETLDIEYRYKQRVSKGEGSIPQLSLDVHGTVVYKHLSLVEFLTRKGFLKRGKIDNRVAKRLNHELQGIRLVPMHRKGAKPFTCKGISQQTVLKQTFKGADGRQDTVFEYMTRTYPKLKMSKFLPCVRASTRKSIFYPMECLMIVKEQKFSREIPRQAISRVHLNPKDRERKIKQGLEKASVLFNAESGLKISTSLIKVKGRELNERSDDRRRQKFSEPKGLKQWIVLVADDRLDKKDLTKAVDVFVKTARFYGMQVNKPTAVVYLKRNERLNSVAGRYKGLEFCLLIKHQFDNRSYEAAKRYSWIESGVPVQVCLSKHFTRTDERRLRAYMSNLLLKVNIKLGGANFKPKPAFTNKLPEGRTLFLGMDACHGDINKAMKQGTSNVATMALIGYDPQLNKFISSFTSQVGRADVLEKDKMIQLLSQMNVNFNEYDSVVLFRDGVGESMFKLVVEKELEALTAFLGTGKKITLVVFTKRHRTRFFRRERARNGQMEMVNPSAGTVVDTVVTNKHEFDFYLQAHQCRLGSAKLPHYTVLKDDNQFTPDNLQGLTNDLSSLYQRSFGAVSQTCTAYCSHVLAEKCRFLLNSRGELPQLHQDLSPLYFM